ncbi:MAG: hypothetical protein M3R17_11545 [Bacteroidota bacterium]|nr:hypothetical protein [Bacteroidota bacterium]
MDFIKKWEGGLSNDPRDSFPASHPAPCYYMGQSGWHTNKGIIYSTFESNAAKLGYEASCDNFIKMPEHIWLKIYKASFWDKFLLDGYRSQSLADIIVSLAWGSGIAGAYKQLAKFFNTHYGETFPTASSAYSLEHAKKFRQLFNHLSFTGMGEKRVHEKLIQHLRQFYISLNNPTYIKGWLNRVNALNDFTYSSLRAANTERKILIVTAIAGSVAVLSLAGYLFSENKKQHRQVA